jgi:arylsulfatase A-like enzyme
MISPFGQRHAAWWFYAGFNEIHNTGLGGMESAEQVDPVLFPWLERNAQRDQWFLHINFWDPHTPYRVPLSYGEPFAGEPLPSWLDDDRLIQRHRELPGPHTLQDIGMYHDRADPRFPRSVGAVHNRADMRKLIDGYDTGIRYADDRVGLIIDHLRRAGVLDETLIIVSSDHGENMGELGIYAEHATADQGTCRIPLVVRGPGVARGVVDPHLRYNLDLAPTLMNLLGRSPCDIWDGSSFHPSLAGKPAPAREHLVISQCAHVFQRSVRWDRWLYIRTYHCGFHDWADEMLFDVEADPHEQIDLASRHPHLLEQGRSRLMHWHDRQMHRMIRHASDSTDPLWQVMREGGPFHARTTSPGNPGGRDEVEAYLGRLESTGRGPAAARLRAKYLG